MQKKDILDSLSVIGLVVGSVSSVVSQQISLAAIPLSLSVTLQVLNRRQLLNEMNHEHQGKIVLQTKAIEENQTEIASLNGYSQEHRATLETLSQQLGQMQEFTSNLSSQLNRYSQEHQNNLETLSQQLGEVQEFSSNLSSQLNEYSQEHQNNLETLSQQLGEIQEFTSNLSTETKEVNEFSKDLGNQHQQLKEVVNELVSIEKFSQAIRAMQDPAKFHYQRGLSHKHLEDRQGAMQDYSEAIKLDPKYAEAYHERAILHAEMGQKKKAIEDLRKAAKFYFEGGDMDNYQKAKYFSQEFFDLRSLDENQDNNHQDQNLEQSLVGDLFS